MKSAKSVVFTMIVLYVCLVLLAAGDAFGWMLSKLYCEWRMLDVSLHKVIAVTFYVCSVPAYTAIYFLLNILYNIRNGKVFVKDNVRSIGIISWCCIAIMITAIAASFRYLPFIFVTVTMLILFPIVRVVRDLMSKAVDIREENDLTV